MSGPRPGLLALRRHVATVLFACGVVLGGGAVPWRLGEGRWSEGGVVRPVPVQWTDNDEPPAAALGSRPVRRGHPEVVLLRANGNVFDVEGWFGFPCRAETAGRTGPH